MHNTWQAQCQQWFKHPVEAGMLQLRQSVTAEQSPAAIRFLLAELSRLPGQTAAYAALLAYYLAVDHGHWVQGRRILTLLDHAVLPALTFVRLAAGLEFKAGDPDAAWARLEPARHAEAAVDRPLVELWYRLSAGRQTDLERATLLASWMDRLHALRHHPTLWLKRGNLHLLASQLQPAIVSFRAGSLAWIGQPESQPPAAKLQRGDARSAEPALFRLLVATRAAGLTLVPTGGTLLGLEREGHLLPGDKDADLTCPAEQLKAALTWFASQGWQPLKKKPELANYHSFGHADFPVAIDLFPCWPEPERNTLLLGWWLAAGQKEEGRFTRLPAVESVLRPTPSGEICYPADPDTILATIYGDWRIPDPDFDTVVMAHHLVAFTPLVASYAYHRLLNALLEQRYSKALRYAAHLHDKGVDRPLFLKLRPVVEQRDPARASQIP